MVSRLNAPQNYRRSRTEILATLIKILENGGHAKHAAEKAHINYRQLKRYLNELMRLELIESYQENGRKLYRSSAKGKLYLEYFENLKKMLT